jgi:hypothetical protein
VDDPLFTGNSGNDSYVVVLDGNLDTDQPPHRSSLLNNRNGFIFNWNRPLFFLRELAVQFPEIKMETLIGALPPPEKNGLARLKPTHALLW